MNKIFLLTQTENKNYNTFDSCVVVALNEEDAKTLYFNEKEFEGFSTWAKEICFYNKIECIEIGIAYDQQKRGVICSSFSVDK